MYASIIVFSLLFNMQSTKLNNNLTVKYFRAATVQNAYLALFTQPSVNLFFYLAKTKHDQSSNDQDELRGITSVNRSYTKFQYQCTAADICQLHTPKNFGSTYFYLISIAIMVIYFVLSRILSWLSFKRSLFSIKKVNELLIIT